MRAGARSVALSAMSRTVGAALEEDARARREPLTAQAALALERSPATCVRAETARAAAQPPPKKCRWKRVVAMAGAPAVATLVE